MKLKQKIALVMAAAILLMVGLNAAVLLPVSDGFSSIEEDEAGHNGERVREAIRVRLDAMARSVMDWSHWDESYRFVAGGEDAFTDENLTFESFATLGVNLVYFYDRAGNVVWGKVYDLNTGNALTLRQFAPGALAADDVLLAGTERQSSQRGILNTVAGPMLIVSAPVVPTADTGPANGTLIFGRFFDDETVTAIRSQILVDFDVLTVDPHQDPGFDGFAITARQPGVLIGSETIADIYGAPAVMLRSQTPRHVTRAGDQTIGFALIALACVGLVDIIVMWVLLQRLVLKPVSQFTDHVLEVRETGRLDKRLPAGGADEFGVLGQEYNAMLDRLAEAQRQVMKRAREADAARYAAEQANEAKTTFLTNMSHELRTPLNAIIGFSDLILHGAHGPIGHPKYREYVGDINVSGNHLLSLITTILNLAQASNGKLTLDERALELGDVIEDSLRFVHPQAIEAKVSVTLVAHDVLPTVEGDRTKLTQVLVNILSNAVKFTPEGGSVHVAAGLRDDGSLEITVKDTGIGMNPEDIPDALKPFVQLNDDHGRVGTGLGLPLSVALVELHGGRLSLDSAVGEGTTVTIHLPADRITPVTPVAGRLISRP